MIKIIPMSSLVTRDDYVITHYIKGLSKDAVLLFNKNNSNVMARYLPESGNTLDVISDDESALIIAELRKGETSFSHCYEDRVAMVWRFVEEIAEMNDFSRLVD